MSSLPYVLIVLFAMGDGTVATIQTAQSFHSPLSCSMRAFLENESSRDRTYVCVTRQDALVLTGDATGLAVAQKETSPGAAKSAR